MDPNLLFNLVEHEIMVYLDNFSDMGAKMPPVLLFPAFVSPVVRQCSRLFSRFGLVMVFIQEKQWEVIAVGRQSHIKRLSYYTVEQRPKSVVHFATANKTAFPASSRITAIEDIVHQKVIEVFGPNAMIVFPSIGEPRPTVPFSGKIRKTSKDENVLGNKPKLPSWIDSPSSEMDKLNLSLQRPTLISGGNTAEIIEQKLRKQLPANTAQTPPFRNPTTQERLQEKIKAAAERFDETISQDIKRIETYLETLLDRTPCEEINDPDLLTEDEINQHKAKQVGVIGDQRKAKKTKSAPKPTHSSPLTTKLFNIADRSSVGLEGETPPEFPQKDTNDGLLTQARTAPPAKITLLKKKHYSILPEKYELPRDDLFKSMPSNLNPLASKKTPESYSLAPNFPLDESTPIKSTEKDVSYPIRTAFDHSNTWEDIVKRVIAVTRKPSPEAFDKLKTSSSDSTSKSKLSKIGKSDTEVRVPVEKSLVALDVLQKSKAPTRKHKSTRKLVTTTQAITKPTSSMIPVMGTTKTPMVRTAASVVKSGKVLQTVPPSQGKPTNVMQSRTPAVPPRDKKLTSGSSYKRSGITERGFYNKDYPLCPIIQDEKGEPSKKGTNKSKSAPDAERKVPSQTSSSRVEKTEKKKDEPVASSSGTVPPKVTGTISKEQRYISELDMKERQSFMDYLSMSKSSNKTFVRVKETNRDFKEAPEDYSLAHCVSEDINIREDIAAKFWIMFGKREELYNQRQKLGELAVLKVGKRYIYYLLAQIDAQISLYMLWKSLKKMCQHAERNKVNNIVIPKATVELIVVEWITVKLMIEFIFSNSSCTITICSMETLNYHDIVLQCAVAHIDHPIVNMPSNFALIYFGFEDGYISKEMKDLNKKFNILHDYRTQKQKLGQVVKSARLTQKYMIYGFIIAKTRNHPFDYIALKNCAVNFNRMMEDNDYANIAVDMYTDHVEYDHTMVCKICHILQDNIEYYFKVYVSWANMDSTKMLQH